MIDPIVHHLHQSGALRIDEVRRWIVVRSSPRRGAQYLDKTIEQIDVNGGRDWPHKFIVSDGTINTRSKWPVMAYQGPSGCQKSFFRIIDAFAKCPGHEYVTYEDDVDSCQNATSRILTSKVPVDCAYVSFCDVKEYIKIGHNPGLYRVPANGLQNNGFWGNQCVLLPPRTITYLANAGNPAKFWPKSNGDVALGRMIASSPWPRYGLHVPSLVKHIGEISTWTDKGLLGRQTPNFPGIDFDAQSLPQWSE